MLTPLASAFRAVQPTVIGASIESPDGVVFGIQSLSQLQGSIFVEIIHDWDTVRRAITPLVLNVANALYVIG